MEHAEPAIPQPHWSRSAAGVWIAPGRQRLHDQLALSAGGITDTVVRFSQGGVYTWHPWGTDGNFHTPAGSANLHRQPGAGLVTICRAARSPDPANTDGVDIEISIGGAVHVDSCMLQGKVRYTYGDNPKFPLGFGSVCLTNVKTYGPVLLDGVTGTRCHYDIRGCALLDAKGSPKALFGPSSGTVGTGPIPIAPIPEPVR